MTSEQAERKEGAGWKICVTLLLDQNPLKNTLSTEHEAAFRRGI